jgi:hypothetical protein
MVIRRRQSRRRAALMTEAVVALGILALASLPLTFEFAREHKAARKLYYQAVAMEIVDGELEVLAAGEWRAFRPGPQPYAVTAEAARNLPPGDFVLTVADGRLKLEWIPKARGAGSVVAREARTR